MNTRRKFLTSLGTIGVFSILPGAGRIWRAERPIVTPEFWEFAYCDVNSNPLPVPFQEIMQRICILQGDRLQRERIRQEIAEEIQRRTGMWPTSMKVSPLP
jgi:hypothetical protein